MKFVCGGDLTWTTFVCRNERVRWWPRPLYRRPWLRTGPAPVQWTSRQVRQRGQRNGQCGGKHQGTEAVTGHQRYAAKPQSNHWVGKMMTVVMIFNTWTVYVVLIKQSADWHKLAKNDEEALRSLFLFVNFTVYVFTFVQEATETQTTA